MLIRLMAFKGMAPSVDPSVLGDMMAQLATNCRLGMGSIKPILLPATSGTTPSNSGVTKSLYKHGSVWFDWLADTNMVRAPISNDSWDRLYWTGNSSTPKMSVVESVNGYPTRVSYELGVPAPEDAIVATASGTITNDADSAVEPRSYVYTYVSKYGEEGPPSTPSAYEDWSPGQVMELTGMSTGPVGNHNIMYKNIYRTNVGTSTTEFQFVATVVVAEDTYTDEKINGELGEVIPTTDWDVPPSGLSGLISLPSGSLFGYADNLLCRSVAYMPNAWPTSWRIPTDYPIVTIGGYGNNILVTTTGTPYVATDTGAAPTLEKLELGYACVSKRGFVDIGYSCVYPAVNGMMMAGMNNIELVTKELLTQKDWDNLNPSSIHAYLWDNKVVGFWDNNVSEGFIFDPATRDLSYHDVEATAGFHDPATGKLYIIDGNAQSPKIVAWDSDSNTPIFATWKSKKITMPFPLNLAAAQVFAATYPAAPYATQLLIYADGGIKHTQTVTSNAPFRLPSGFRATTYEVEIRSTAVINGIMLSDSMAELAQT